MKTESIFFIITFVILSTACSQTSVQTEVINQANATVLPTQAGTKPVEVEPPETPVYSTAIPEPTDEGTLELSTDLVRACDRTDGTDLELQEGDPAFDFSLMDVDGSTFILSELLNEKPVALIYGSYT